MSSLRVLLGIHHPLDPNLGAPGVTLALGQALQGLGCEVSYYGYGEAFPGVTSHSALHSLRFPWTLSAWLAREAHRFDVLDITTGDCWPWARVGRPGARRRQALVTRSHGLEHLVSEQLRADVRAGRAQVSWKYPLYHGGFRLWEVRESLRLADHAVLLNPQDRDFVRDRLGVPGERLSVIPHGLSGAFLERPAPEPGAPEGPVRIAFVGSWLQRKGREELVAVAAALRAQGVPFSLELLGTGAPEDEVRGAFSPDVRAQVRVVPRYRNEDLPGLLQGAEILLFPSHAEGYGMALVEAMACGLAPVTTPVGVAPEVVRDGQTGRLLRVGDVAGLTQAVRALAEDRPRLLALRQAAQRVVKGMTWQQAGIRTLRMYEQAISMHS
ncbi:Glycosyltransferase involved in cell wall bisynthesis [Stigmatella aurantiaca]|uniref:Glycosyltransferase involved in cell wall bisynthesis n=1 Tax=Stigmatella aurantiaca TaxID=41 RepID=A0A1H8DZJ5_STIAU|nr:glycosyltransferase family 4 protein [Stigmatella aurantiaca]SEN12610.1 Glycosyltransferase involved in cell wall bisynthesis [Stigmatella aurantiaca]